MSRPHVNRADHPNTLHLVERVMKVRTAEWYEPTEEGAWIDFDAAAESWLSSSERGLMRVAQGLYALEWTGLSDQWAITLGAVVAGVIGKR